MAYDDNTFENGRTQATTQEGAASNMFVAGGKGVLQTRNQEGNIVAQLAGADGEVPIYDSSSPTGLSSAPLGSTQPHFFASGGAYKITPSVKYLWILDNDTTVILPGLDEVPAGDVIEIKFSNLPSPSDSKIMVKNIGELIDKPGLSEKQATSGDSFRFKSMGSSIGFWTIN